MNPTAVFGPVRIYAGQKNGKYPDGNQLIVQGTERRAVFDSPLIANEIGKDFDEADLVIQGHIHEDHVTGLHRLPEAPVYVHEGDLPALVSWEGFLHAFGTADDVSEAMRPGLEQEFYFTPRPDAIGYEDGATWDLGAVTVRAIHLPGHTAGHCALLIEEVGVLFIGDIELSSFGPYYGSRSSSLGEFRNSLATLPDLPAEVWITSHHRGIYTNRAHFLRDLADFGDKMDKRNEQLLTTLRKQPHTVDEIVAKGFLYTAENPLIWMPDSERWTIIYHLEELESQGLVEKNVDGRYQLSSG